MIDINIISSEEIKEALEKAEEERKQKERDKRIPKVIGKCVVCSGDIMQIMKRHYPRGRNFIGKQAVSYYIDGAYCVECGLLYNHSVVK